MRCIPALQQTAGSSAIPSQPVGVVGDRLFGGC
jgi:hypothetical protein